MTASLDSYHHDVFDMDGMDQPFCMDDDYGFYEDLDTDDDTETAAVTPLSSAEESALPATPVCGSRIDDPDGDSLLASPPILTPSVADAIAEDGLPWSMQDTQWERLFASNRDGASFRTFMRSVRGQCQTIIVAKTSDGKIVGGYATDVWSGRKRDDSRDEASHDFLFVVDPPATSKATHAAPETPANHTFIPGLEELGSSPTSAFDFDFHQLSVSSPKATRDDKPHIEIYKPSQKPRDNAGWKQACQLGNKLISMSDASGDLTLVIDNSFSHGTVVRTGEEREEFTIVEFEVYGFSED